MRQAHGPDPATLQGSVRQVSGVEPPGDTGEGAAADRAEMGWACVRALAVPPPPPRQPGATGSVVLPVLERREAMPPSAPGSGTLVAHLGLGGCVCVWELAPWQFLGGRNRVLGKAGSSLFAC